ncbi:acetoin utilization protein acuB [Flavobacteriaceae bacterium F89]|uniref:Acetoin utilization protein acuB n=1 Tax=Cerina litoralis TaxID=2874477 RepID=A0AAE3EVX5_9FLAO|nr:acetoin utilization protein acuB [Cerina litoralis]MCG2460596.1 acetoin utilization protein acuB [Cerina litoralis]
MQLQSHIISTIPIFDIGDSMEEVIQFFESTTFSHAAIMEGVQFLGVLGENDLEIYRKEQKVEDYRQNLETFFVMNDTSWLGVLETFARNEANILPVLGVDHTVLGYYDLTDVVRVFIESPFFTEPGGIIVLAKGIKDYSFSEISQIVEGSGARMIGGFISAMRNEVIQITIKVGAVDLNEVLQTFRRYNYTVLFGNRDDQFLEDLKQRSDYLDKYLNV